MKKPKKTIVICTSATFYEHANQIAEELVKMGYSVIIPTTTEKMKKSGDYDVKKVKTWFDNSELFNLKQNLAREHFGKITKGDAVLILNDDKPGQPAYIGPNTLMEWGLAYYLGRPVFILNGVSKNANTYEEVYGMSTAVLNGDLGKIKL